MFTPVIIVSVVDVSEVYAAFLLTVKTSMSNINILEVLSPIW
jgi:hypothetical protein